MGQVLIIYIVPGHLRGLVCDAVESTMVVIIEPDVVRFNPDVIRGQPSLAAPQTEALGKQISTDAEFLDMPGRAAFEGCWGWHYLTQA